MLIMKVVCAFKLPDGTVTEKMTVEEIDQKIKKYNLQSKDIRDIFYNYIKVLTEVTYDVEIKIES